MCKLVLNSELNGVELYFGQVKPAKEILTDLKSNGFRWNGKKICWYAKQNNDTLQVANKYSNGTILEVAAVTPVKEVKNNTIDLWDLTRIEKWNTPLNYDTKVIAKEVRQHLKKRFPFVKFSIRTKSNSINCDIVASPFEENSKYLLAIQNYCKKYINSYNYNNSDLMSDYHDVNFYGGYFETAWNYEVTELENIEEIKKNYNTKLAAAEQEKKEQEEREWQEYLKQEKIKEAEREAYKINRFFEIETSKLSIEQSEKELDNIEKIINENLENEELRLRLRDVENNIKYNYSSRLEAIEGGSVEITIDGEGLTEWGIVSTFDIEEATKELNKRIKYVYDNCGGYLKTWVTIKGKDFDIEQRYDLDDTMDTIENLYQFMAEDKKEELEYMINNSNKMTWIKDIDREMIIKENLINLFEELANKNNCKVKESHVERDAAIGKIIDTELYSLKRISNEYIISEKRLVKNDYYNGVVVVYGKDLKDIIREGRNLHIKDIELYNTDIEHFMDGLYRIAAGKCISLFPTKEDILMARVNMYDRFLNNKNRVIG